ncbi:MAG: YeeE/YedE family protein [Rhodospirillales bacterium]|nr:YeeE/YedE family protein [Rhodospirillales bacterium]
MDQIDSAVLVPLLAFGLGGLLGATAQRTQFCTMGAISDVFFIGDWNRFRAWMLATATAIVGTQALVMADLVDLQESIYLSTNLGWAGAIIGGLMFGFGMTLGGGCGNKTLVRLGAGNLKSLVVAMVLGIFAYMTLRGLIGVGRVQLEAMTVIDLASFEMESQGIPEFLMMLGLDADVARLISVVLIGGGLLVFCFKSAAFRKSRADVAAGLIIGGLIVCAWFVTGFIGYDDFEPTPVASFSFVAPIAEGLQYLMTFTGAKINFGIAAVGGIIFGSFLSAKLAGEFRVESFVDAADMGRHLSGGALMGVGGVLALGCTIGQGVSGMSTLAFGSLIALASIIGGGVFGMKYLEEGSFKAVCADLFSRS